MIRDKKEGKSVRKDKSLTATGIVIAVIMALLVLTYFLLIPNLRQRSLNRLEDGANTAIEGITSEIERDSYILNAIADIISQADNFDIEATLAIMKTTNPLLETMNVSVLLPDNRILSADGTVIEAADNDDISFEEEAPLGEHISNRTYDHVTGKPILRHYVPIVQDGETVALLYGVTDLETLPEILNVENIFNGNAFLYIIDTRTGDLLVDTWHDSLENIEDYSGPDYGRETKGKKNWDEYKADLNNLNSGYVIYRTPNTEGWEYMYYSPIGVNKWSVAVDVPEKVAFAGVFAVRRAYILLGVLMAVTVILYYLWVRRNAKQMTEWAVEHAVLAEILTDKGFIVETAEDGTVAVEKVKNSAPGYYSLVLMDIQMPKMNGYDATRAIRALDDPELAAIPIVAMTANAFEEDRQQAFDSGMNAHVAKPIDREKLLEVIADILKECAGGK